MTNINKNQIFIKHESTIKYHKLPIKYSLLRPKIKLEQRILREVYRGKTAKSPF